MANKSSSCKVNLNTILSYIAHGHCHNPEIQNKDIVFLSPLHHIITCLSEEKTATCTLLNGGELRTIINYISLLFLNVLAKIQVKNVLHTDFL